MVHLLKVVVDYFPLIPGSGYFSLKESFATLMKHSVRTQEKYSDEGLLAPKKERAINQSLDKHI